MKYTYRLHPVDEAKYNTYTFEELSRLTTLELREICQIEKLAVATAFKLDREHLIKTILKFRGANLFVFINTPGPKSLDLVLEKFASFLEFTQPKNLIYLPARITLYKSIEVTAKDNHIIDGEGLFDGNVLLLDGNKKIKGILNIKNIAGKFYLLCNNKLLEENLEEALHKNYSLGFLEEKGSKYLYNYYYETGILPQTKLYCHVIPISELVITDIQEATTPLVIDFGTSNTSAGAYLDEHLMNHYAKEDLQKNGINLNDINKVEFADNLILPTIISVKDCSDTSNIVYRYGYEALKYTRENSYDSPASVFFGLKKWINNYNKEIEIADEKGNKATITRNEILRAYFKYIIAISEQQHKCSYKALHITSPVKQKQQFLQMYKEVLYDYEIVTEAALDEGIAVLYNYISSKIEQNKFKDNAEYQALIIDCGGGTTDLTSCTYKIRDNNITYELDLITTYANGETNFGGNNITYRIFQYLKIILAKYYNDEPAITIKDIFAEQISDVYRYVDEYGSEEAYKPLEELYAACENIIPTRFYDYKNSPSEDYMKIRSNFYFLWSLAEKIKIDFYQTLDIVQTSFHKQGLKEDENNRKVLASEAWRLNVYKDTKHYDPNRNVTTVTKGLTLITDLPQVVITEREITSLIKADIYHIIKKFIEPLYMDGTLDNFDFIKLTGQTCKIDIFRDALKEYIPGRVIEASKREKDILNFKLTCLEGAAKYQNAQKIGTIAPKLENKAPITPYKLIAHTHTGAEVVMISISEELSQSYGFVSRNINTETVELILQDVENKLLHKYPLITRIRNFKTTSYNEIKEEYSDKIPQDDVDGIVNDEIRIFTFAGKDIWGFFALPIARRDEVLFIGEKKYLPFENDEWELNFFDGKK